MLRLLGVIVLVGVGGPAEAKEPRREVAVMGVERSALTFSEYMDFLDSVELDAVVRLDEERVRVWFSTDPKDGEALRVRAVDLCDALKAQILAQDYPPQAAQVRAAYLAHLTYTGSEYWGSDWDEAVALRAMRPVRVENRERLEALEAQSRARGKALAEARDEAVRDYAAASNVNLTLVEAPPLASSFLPVFVHPDFPPRSSELSSVAWISFPANYANHVVGLSSELMEIHNAWVALMGLGPDKAGDGREELHDRIKALRARAEKVEPWEGDGAIAATLLANIEEAQALLGPLAKEYVAIAEQKRVSQEEAARANAYVHRVNATAERVNALAAQVDAFRRRWGITAYMDWLAAQQPTPI